MDLAYIKSVLRQIKVLAWKNALLKWRHVSVLLIELAIPIIIVLAIYGLKEISLPKYVGPVAPESYNPSYSLESLLDGHQTFGSICYGTSLVWR